LHAKIQLVPPTLKVIASIIVNKKELHYVVAQLEDAAYQGISYSQLAFAGLPKVKYKFAGIGHGLTVAYTETIQDDGQRRGLVWVSELSCHPVCVLLGRVCLGNLNTFQWLERIEKKHLEMLDKIPSV
jgi:hypothetical protein